jgi:(S)-3,5-dihydroxyphenylglycine transaminase
VRIRLKPCFDEPILNVMNFLNEVVLDYPEAISFAPGRPMEEGFQVAETVADLERFTARSGGGGGAGPDPVEALGQYNRTNGIIQDLLARHLELDEGIRVPPAAIQVTVGCQEAMAILLAGLFEPGDVLLASDPTYIGITGLARILDVPVEPVPAGPEGITAQGVVAALARVRARGQRPRALYDVPDFNNPLGTTLPVAVRRELLEIAAREEILIFEDNPYGMFAFDGEPAPTLKSMDTAGVVIYLGTVSKTLFPGLRLGYLVADQMVEGAEGGDGPLLAVELSKVKSLTTVTTSPLIQAMVGGTLLRTGGSLKALVAPKVDLYRRNRDAMVAALERELGDLAPGVTWNRPAGGFFLTLNLPFPFDTGCLKACAAEGVIVCPMTYFALDPAGREQQVRLAFSYVTPEEIDQGIARLAAFVRQRLATTAVTGGEEG